MHLHAFLRALPKVELHNHLQGTVRPKTFVEIAGKHRIPLPAYEQPEELYRHRSALPGYPSIGPAFRMAAEVLRDAGDYQRVTYEALAEAAANGVRYVEMFYSVRYLQPFGEPGTGAPHAVALDGMLVGMRDAETDYGIQCRLIAGLSRMETPDKNVAMVQSTLDHRRDQIIGIGMGGYEPKGPPEWFVDAYRLAEKAGLHLTCHSAEQGPAVNVQTSLDLLHCERIDHGYHVIEDDQITQRCVDEGVCFTVCPTTSAQSSGWKMSEHPIREMARRGLKIMINSDDSGTSGTDLGREYILMADQMGFSPGDFKRFVLNGIDGAWLDDSTKRAWRAAWSREIDEWARQLA